MTSERKLERALDRTPATTLESEAASLVEVAIRRWGDDAVTVLTRALETVLERVQDWTPRTPPAFTPAPNGPPEGPAVPVENPDSGAETGPLAGDRGEGGGSTPSPGLFDALRAGSK